MTVLNFEQTYIRYPFAPLVSLGLILSAYFVRHKVGKNTDTGYTNNMPHAA